MKRKFKILILTISVIAMLFAFAIVSSAAVPETFDDDLDNNSSWLMGSDYSEYSNRLIVLRDGDFHQLAYFYVDSTVGQSIESDFGGSQISIEQFQTLFDPTSCFFIDMVVNYINFFNYLNNNSYDSLGEVGELSEFQYARDVYLCLKNSYTQTDLDNAVSEATKDMYTQEQLSEAVAKALKEGNLNPNNYLIYIPSSATVADVAEGTEESFVAQELVEGSFSYFVVSLNGGHMEKIVVANALEFQEFCKKHEITDLSSLMTKVSELQEIVTYDNYEAYEWLNSLFAWSESLFDFFYNYDPLTQEEYEAGLNAEKLAGAEEFKSSEEYTNTINLAKESGIDEYKASEEYINALNNKYSTGYTEGVEAFKASDAYADSLYLQYSNGKIAGANDFKASVEFANSLKAKYNSGLADGANVFKESEEYKNALNAEYINGFNEGVSFVNVPTDDVEDDFTVIFALLGASLLVIAFLVISVKASKKKNKTNYR